MFANSTVLMLQKWQTPKFGAVQNFQIAGGPKIWGSTTFPNTGGPKKGGGDAGKIQHVSF